MISCVLFFLTRTFQFPQINYCNFPPQIGSLREFAISFPPTYKLALPDQELLNSPSVLAPDLELSDAGAPVESPLRTTPNYAGAPLLDDYAWRTRIFFGGKALRVSSSETQHEHAPDFELHEDAVQPRTRSIEPASGSSAASGEEGGRAKKIDVPIDVPTNVPPTNVPPADVPTNVLLNTATAPPPETSTNSPLRPLFAATGGYHCPLVIDSFGEVMLLEEHDELVHGPIPEDGNLNFDLVEADAGLLWEQEYNSRGTAGGGPFFSEGGVVPPASEERRKEHSVSDGNAGERAGGDVRQGERAGGPAASVVVSGSFGGTTRTVRSEEVDQNFFRRASAAGASAEDARGRPGRGLEFDRTSHDDRVIAAGGVGDHFFTPQEQSPTNFEVSPGGRSLETGTGEGAVGQHHFPEGNFEPAEQASTSASGQASPSPLSRTDTAVSGNYTPSAVDGSTTTTVGGGGSATVSAHQSGIRKNNRAVNNGVNITAAFPDGPPCPDGPPYYPEQQSYGEEQVPERSPSDFSSPNSAGSSRGDRSPAEWEYLKLGSPRATSPHPDGGPAISEFELVEAEM